MWLAGVLYIFNLYIYNPREYKNPIFKIGGVDKKKTIPAVHLHKGIAYFKRTFGGETLLFSKWERDCLRSLHLFMFSSMFHTVIKVKCQKQNGNMATGVAPSFRTLQNAGTIL